MRHSLWIVLLLLFSAVSPAEAQPKDDPPPETLAKGKLDVYLETGGHSLPILYAGFTKDDNRLVTVGQEGSIQVWDLATGKRLQKVLLPVMDRFHAATMSPDDRTVAVIGSGKVFGYTKKGGPPSSLGILLVNMDDGRILTLNSDFGVEMGFALAFAHAGDQMATTNKAALCVWPNMDKLWDKAISLTSKERVQFLKPRTYSWKGAMPQVQFSPDDSQIFVGNFGKTRMLFDATLGAETKPGVPVKSLWKLPKGKWYLPTIYSLAWSMDGKSVFLAGNGSQGVGHFDNQGELLKKFNDWTKPSATEKEKSWLLGEETKIRHLHPLDENTVLLSGSALLNTAKGAAGYIGASILNLKTGTTDLRLKMPELAEDLSLTTVAHDRKRAATTVNSGRDVLLWNIADGQVVRRLASQAQTPVRVGWLKDKKRYVLAWGYGSDPTHKDFGTFSKAFDLDKLELVNEVKPADYAGRLHQFGPWSVTFQTGTFKQPKKDVKFLNPHPKDYLAVTLIPTAGADTNLAYADSGGGIALVKALGKKKDIKYSSASVRWPHIHDLAASPDGKYLAVATGTQQICIYNIRDHYNHLLPVMDLYFTGQDWVAFARNWNDKILLGQAKLTGHYAASPGGEKLMGWVVSDTITTQATYHPASRFRKNFYRPDVIARILKDGNLSKALAAANVTVKAAGGTVQKEVELESVLPPTGFIAKVDTSKLPKVTVYAQAAASDKELVTKLELLADGRPLFGKDGVKELSKPQRHVTATFAVELPPGAYKLTVRIHSQKRWSVSTEAHVHYAPPASAKLPKAKLHVLAIGASVYQNHPGLDLPSPANDAKKIAEVLPQQCGLPLFAPGSSKALLGPQATSANVYQAIKDLSKQVRPEDVVVIYFGGHGLKAPSGGLYLLTHDTKMSDLEQTAVSGARLRDALSKVECRGLILIMDACHSGLIGPKTRPVVDDLTRELTDDDCGVVVWCSAMGHEKAQVDSKSGHGLFTLSLLKALDGQKGAPPSKYDGKVYLTGIQAFVFEEVVHHGGQRQHPSLNIPWTVEAFPLRAVK